MKSRQWLDECWRLALGVAVAIVCSLVTDTGLWFLAAFLLAYCVWMIFRFHELEFWLRDGGQKIAAPDTIGIASEIMQLIYRDKKSSAKTRERLRASLSQFNDMAAELPDATIVLDDHHQIRWSNAAASQLLGISRTRDSGQRIDNLIRNPEFQEFLHQSDAKAEIEMQSPINRQLTVALRRVPTGNSMSILTGHDVTQRVAVREMRKTFVANVSHELRTPLTVIQGYLEMLSEDDSIPDRAQNALTNVSEQSDRMVNIVSDLLTLSKLESSLLSASEGRPVDVAAVVRTIIDEVTVTSESRHVFTTDLDSHVRIKGKENEIFSACQNLVQNAIRYTDVGTEITIGWKKRGTGSVFSVTDQGIGIESHHLPRLSERFYRVDTDRSRQSGGTGLGLAIVKYIAQRHSGKLNIQSQPGVGSTFEIEFPAIRTLSHAD